MISFVIPTHNRVDMLRRAVDSALAQTVPIEIVIVDGGSTDGTKDYLRDLEINSTVHVETLHRDPGMMPTWYLGASVSRGEWIHFLLDDDWNEPEFASKCSDLFADDVAIVMTNASICHDDGRREPNLPGGNPTGHYQSGDLHRAMMKMPLTISPSCAVVRRGPVLDFLAVSRLPWTPRRSILGDIPMMLGALASAPRAGWVNEPLSCFGAHPGSITIKEMARDGGGTLALEYAGMKGAWIKNLDGYRMGR